MRLKKSLNISTLFINYQQLVIAVYINYGSRPSPRCVFMFHGCITSWDVKYLLWHVPVTLISPINKCNILLLPWKIAGKCDQSAGYRRQPAAILNPAFRTTWIKFPSALLHCMIKVMESFFRAEKCWRLHNFLSQIRHMLKMLDRKKWKK